MYYFPRIDPLLEVKSSEAQTWIFRQVFDLESCRRHYNQTFQCCCKCWCRKNGVSRQNFNVPEWPRDMISICPASRQLSHFWEVIFPQFHIEIGCPICFVPFGRVDFDFLCMERSKSKASQPSPWADGTPNTPSFLTWPLRWRPTRWWVWWRRLSPCPPAAPAPTPRSAAAGPARSPWWRLSRRRSRSLAAARSFGSRTARTRQSLVRGLEHMVSGEEGRLREVEEKWLLSLKKHPTHEVQSTKTKEGRSF